MYMYVCQTAKYGLCMQGRAGGSRVAVANYGVSPGWSAVRECMLEHLSVTKSVTRRFLTLLRFTPRIEIE